MSHWHATLIYYTISALENSNKFLKVILWLFLLMFPFTPPLLLLIPSSSPPKHSDISSPCSLLRTLQDLQYAAHRRGWQHSECIKSSTVSTKRLLGLLLVGSSPTHCFGTGSKMMEFGGAHSLLKSSTRHKKRMLMAEPQKNTNILSLPLWTQENRSLTDLC